MPSGIFHPALHFYDQPTVFQRLEEKGISWRIYYGDVPQSLLMIKQLEFPTHYRGMENFAADVRGPEDQFPQYVFIEPCYFGAGQNDEHPPTDVMHGEALIAEVYNAIRANEQLWQSTLFVLLYDEHGGFFDHVTPPATIAPDDHTEKFAFNELGVRVPALLISPWVDPGVFSVPMDHTSLLRYLTDKWQLGPLGNRVPQANSFANAINRTSARQDCVRSVAAAPATPNSPETPFNAQQVALAAFTHHLEVNHTKPDDHTVAEHSRAMAADFNAQSRAVSERVEQFLAAKAGVQAAARQV
jgi:phospholipase C